MAHRCGGRGRAVGAGGRRCRAAVARGAAVGHARAAVVAGRRCGGAATRRDVPPAARRADARCPAACALVAGVQRAPGAAARGCAASDGPHLRGRGGTAGARGRRAAQPGRVGGRLLPARPAVPSARAREGLAGPAGRGVRGGVRTQCPAALGGGGARRAVLGRRRGRRGRGPVRGAARRGGAAERGRLRRAGPARRRALYRPRGALAAGASVAVALSAAQPRGAGAAVRGSGQRAGRGDADRIAAHAERGGRRAPAPEARAERAGARGGAHLAAALSAQRRAGRALPGGAARARCLARRAPRVVRRGRVVGAGQRRLADRVAGRAGLHAAALPRARRLAAADGRLRGGDARRPPACTRGAVRRHCVADVGRVGAGRTRGACVARVRPDRAPADRTRAALLRAWRDAGTARAERHAAHRRGWPAGAGPARPRHAAHLPRADGGGRCRGARLRDRPEHAEHADPRRARGAAGVLPDPGRRSQPVRDPGRARRALRRRRVHRLAHRRADAARKCGPRLRRGWGRGAARLRRAGAVRRATVAVQADPGPAGRPRFDRHRHAERPRHDRHPLRQVEPPQEVPRR